MTTGPEDESALELRVLADAWHQTRPHWRDGKAREFESHHWQPLFSETSSYLDACAQLNNVLSQAEYETAD
jgi:hypothetical protein